MSKEQFHLNNYVVKFMFIRPFKLMKSLFKVNLSLGCKSTVDIYMCLRVTKESKEQMMMNMKFLILSFFMLLLQFGSTRSSEQEHKWPKSCTNFVLVHGSCHGAWSWYSLVALLRSSGHNVTAIDLAASGINPLQVLDVPSISDYFKPLMDFMDSLPPHNMVVLVGHSLGGLAISKAMESYPKKISVAVFVSAMMPGPTLNISTILKESLARQSFQLDNSYTYDNGPNNPPTTFIFGPKFSAAYVYQLSPVKDLALATTLLRPLYLYSEEDMAKELTLLHENYGSVPRVFIKSNKDKVFTKDFQQWMIERNPTNEVEEIEGSDHMVMMSRPVELSNHLVHIADNYY